MKHLACILTRAGGTALLGVGFGVLAVDDALYLGLSDHTFLSQPGTKCTSQFAAHSFSFSNITLMSLQLQTPLPSISCHVFFFFVLCSSVTSFFFFVPTILI